VWACQGRVDEEQGEGESYRVREPKNRARVSVVDMMAGLSDLATSFATRLIAIPMTGDR
jgi:hypothetical protein